MVMTKIEALKILELSQGMNEDVLTKFIVLISVNLPCISQLFGVWCLLLLQIPRMSAGNLGNAREIQISP